MLPEASPHSVLRLLEAVRRRRILLDAVLVLSTSLCTFAVIQWVSKAFLTPLLATSGSALLASAFGIGLLWSRRKHWTAAVVAGSIEKLRPHCQNVVVTAEELRRHPGRASSWMTATVMDRASRDPVDVRTEEVAPATLAAWSALIGVTVAVAILVAPRAQEAARNVAEAARSAAGRIIGFDTNRITVRVRPPAYTQLAERTFTDPAQLDVLAGSTLTFTVSGSVSRQVRFGQATIGRLPSSSDVEHTARDSGYFTIESVDGGERRFIVLSVTPDAAPVVRVEKPARDLLLPNALGAVPLALAVTDDLGLDSFELRYTKISGSGEQFEFVEGRLPVTLERTSAREWRAHGGIALADLRLGAGDSIVYYGAATDRRPGKNGLGTSDTFFIEIAGPGQVPLDAVGMPPTEDRYALSQQMIVLKIERLRSRQSTLARERLGEEAALIAAEQRSVRANFIFLLGGHIEDEEAEAEQSSEIAEGRLLNTARRDISVAVRHMTRAEQGLTAVETGDALSAARSAVDALQRAFGRSRYFLRVLPATGRVDPSRRLTGSLDAVAAWTRDAAAAKPDEGVRARAILAELLDLSSAVEKSSVVGPAAFEQLAERALSIEPASRTWQDVSERLLSARARLSDRVRVRSILNETVRIVRTEADRGLVPRTALSVPGSPLFRAWEGRRSR